MARRAELVGCSTAVELDIRTRRPRGSGGSPAPSGARGSHTAAAASPPSRCCSALPAPLVDRSCVLVWAGGTSSRGVGRFPLRLLGLLAEFRHPALPIATAGRVAYCRELGGVVRLGPVVALANVAPEALARAISRASLPELQLGAPSGPYASTCRSRRQEASQPPRGEFNYRR